MGARDCGGGHGPIGCRMLFTCGAGRDVRIRFEGDECTRPHESQKEASAGDR